MSDLISRQDAIDACLNGFCACVGDCVDEIEKLPSAQKTGKWIPVDSFSAYGGDQIMWEIRGNPVAFHYCSECREQAYANEDGDEILSEFCPCCGARMVGEEE